MAVVQKTELAKSCLITHIHTWGFDVLMPSTRPLATVQANSHTGLQHGGGQHSDGAQDSGTQDPSRLDIIDLEGINAQMDQSSATELVTWASELMGDGLVLSTSFGIQSAVMLHLVTQVMPTIPVIWVDTGYLPAETYQFADELAARLQLNLHVYQSLISPARMEALYGTLWEHDDVESLNRYDFIRKVEPMQRALKELNATAWLTGLRRDQTQHRQTLQRVNEQHGIYKILPILHWTAKDVYYYLKEYDLPYHPLFDQGYVTVGDWHSSRPLMSSDDHERDTRFHGIKQECGLHLPLTAEQEQSLGSSAL